MSYPGLPQEKKVVSEYTTVDPAKVNKTRRVGTASPDDVRTVDYSRGAGNPAPVNPELFESAAPPPYNPEAVSESRKRRSSATATPTPRTDTPGSQQRNNNTPPSSNSNLTVGLVVVVVVVVFFWWMFSTTSVDGQLQSMTWKYSIPCKEYSLVRREGDTMPPGAVLERMEQRPRMEKVAGSESVLMCETPGERDVRVNRERANRREVYSHTENTCTDDGVCVEEDIYVPLEPPAANTDQLCWQQPVLTEIEVYRPYFYYTEWDWVSVEPAVTQGINSLPYAPHVPEDLRPGKETVTLRAVFSTPKGEYTYTVQKPDEYETLLQLVGQSASLEVGVLGVSSYKFH